MKLFEQTWNHLRRLNIFWADMKLRRRHDIACRTTWNYLRRHEIMFKKTWHCLKRHKIFWKDMKPLENKWHCLKRQQIFWEYKNCLKKWNYFRRHEITWNDMTLLKRHKIAWEDMKLLVKTWNYLTMQTLNCLRKHETTWEKLKLHVTLYNVLCLLDICRVFTVPEAENLKNYSATNSGTPEIELRFWPQSIHTHRVATDTFWRKFHHDGKISPAW